MNDHAIFAKADRAFAIGTALNVLFVIVEAAFGFATDSLALLADAGHNLGDVASLLLAWGASVIARRPAFGGFTYGLRKATILASLVSSLLLMAALGGILVEAVRRLSEPSPVPGMTVLFVAAVGVVINTVSAGLFLRDRERDLNRRAAFLHLAADAAVSLGVVVAGLLIEITDWRWLDPAISIVIAIVIFVTTWDLLRESTRLTLDAAPRDLDLDELATWLRGQPGVSDLHDLHVWALSTTQSALTVHLVAPDGLEDEALGELADHIRARFGIDHATIQVERHWGPCPTEPHESGPERRRSERSRTSGSDREANGNRRARSE